MGVRCKFWLLKKKRFCAIPPLPNTEFCGNHSTRSDDRWIQCSIDPSHSVLESNLENHLRRCPLLKHNNSLSLQPFYQKGINGGDEEDEDVSSESKRMAVQCITVPELIKLIEKIKSVHASICKDIQDSYNIPEVCRNWINRANDCFRKIPFQEKHVIQQASILGNLEKLGAIKSCSSVGEQLHSPAVVEFGAGRGYLTQMLADCYGVSKVFLIERKSYKLKADRSLRQKESLMLERLRIDIEDLNLNAIGSLQGVPYLAIGKHLCGPATDMTLRCCVGENGSTSYLRGLSIATCCHHLCQWKHYINKSFFLSQGMSKDEFHAVTWFTSWAVDSADHEESDTKMENEKVLEGDDDDDDLLRNMCARDRAVLGFMCKDIIDAGRLMWIREHGLEKSELVKYVPSNISPENRLLIASC
ncbi:tRNA:m(4)X modification enzyme TRM13 isoform X2 [Lactuca sativa]|uniref:tRNA:m(4)X modification enzyme TRM13 isoform X2 n=1 Tax=Lactuca sativa TaxID=4236 RepID=UPI000CD9ACBE|nr:tRNA:m(4)X modification enzyme TRM13 isoform X2 [Lactuca sativa]